MAIRAIKKFSSLLITAFLLSFSCHFAFAIDSTLGFNSYRRISMDFRDANLKDVLKIFSQQSGLNFVAASDIKDITLTLYLDNVAVQEALDKLLYANGLVYDLDPDGNIFVVNKSLAPAIKTKTKVFYLKFARLPGSSLDTAISGGSGDAEGGGEQGGASTGSSDILSVMKNVLTENGKVVVEKGTNSLIVTDIAENFPVIEEIVAKLDILPAQVMIEVEMLDVNRNIVDRLGFNISGQFQLKGAGPLNTTFPFWGSNDILDKAQTLGDVPPTGTEFKYGTIGIENFQVLFDFLSSSTDSKVLARPRILTLNNESAEIKISSNEAIGVTTTTDEDGNVTVEPERAETGVILKVTPQVNLERDEITMYIYPKTVEASSNPVTLMSKGLEYTFFNPEERSTKTAIKVKDGETILLGGLIRNSKTLKRTKLPFFASIPLLGMLFRNKDQDKRERELLVFLTPRIVKEPHQTEEKSFAFSGPNLDLGREQTLSGRDLEVDRLLKQYDIR